MEAQRNSHTVLEVVVRSDDVLFACPRCAKNIAIDKAVTGMIVSCPHCQGEVILQVQSTPDPVVLQQEMSSGLLQECLLGAAEKGDLILLNKSIELGADINAAGPDGTTALMYAAQQGHDKIVEALLSRGANLEIKRADGQTAAMLAGRTDHMHILRMIWKAAPKRERTYLAFGRNRRR